MPGYNRFPANDFPRLAISDRYQTVSMVWYDARLHAYGDIMLQSFKRGSLTGTTGTRHRVKVLSNRSPGPARRGSRTADRYAGAGHRVYRNP